MNQCVREGLQTIQVTLLNLHEHIGSSLLLQTIQVTLFTLHEHMMNQCVREG
jgi:hypothetical protein